MFDELIKKENRDLLYYFLSNFDEKTLLKLSLASKTLYKEIHKDIRPSVGSERPIERLRNYKLNYHFSKELEDAKPYLKIIDGWKTCKNIQGGSMQCLIYVYTNDNKMCYDTTDISIEKGEKKFISRQSDLFTIKSEQPYRITTQEISDYIDIPANTEYLCPIPLACLPYSEINIVNTNQEKLSLKIFHYYLGDEPRIEAITMKCKTIPFIKDENKVMEYSSGSCHFENRIPYRVIDF